MALKRKKMLKAIGVASAVFGIVAAMTGAVGAVIYTVGYFGLPEYLIAIAILVPAFVFMVITAYKEQ
jgi:hypothetical protein